MIPSKHGGAYRTPSTKEEDMKLVSHKEYRARNGANEGWTVVAVLAFIAATICASIQFAVSTWTPTVLAIGAALAFVLALMKKREHYAIVKQYWAQPCSPKETGEGQ